VTKPKTEHEKMTERTDPLKTQAIICKCGAILGACVEPDRFADNHWKKTIKKAIKDGHTITTMTCHQVRATTWQCSCKKEASK